MHAGTCRVRFAPATHPSSWTRRSRPGPSLLRPGSSRTALCTRGHMGAVVWHMALCSAGGPRVPGDEYFKK